MNVATQRVMGNGPCGGIEVAVDEPVGACQGTAVIAHPHPLFGGTMDNKVVQTLARAALQQGWRAVRFNFRGVGSSAGQYAQGIGERDDMQAVIDQFAGDGALVLCGFSFGAAVASHVLTRVREQGRDVRAVVLVGTAASRFDVAAIPADGRDRALIVHGEVDETVPLASVMAWARPQAISVTVMPGGEHFFHGRLPELKALVMRHLAGVQAVL